MKPEPIPSTSSPEPGTLFATANSTLLAPYSLDTNALQGVLGSIMTHRVDYADLYFQYSRAESWGLEEGQVKLINGFEFLLIDLDGIEQAGVSAGSRADLVDEGAQLDRGLFKIIDIFDHAIADQLGLQIGHAAPLFFKAACDGFTQDLICVAAVLAFNVPAKPRDVGQ